MPAHPMYSHAWFETFATAEPASSLDGAAVDVAPVDVAAITRLCPQTHFPRILELGCGNGRITGPLAALGYDVVGIDINAEVLAVAQTRAPGPRYLALDQRDVSALRCTFDAALVLWNSIGFGTRSDDDTTLRGIAHVVRPGGKLLMDLYHPEWLADQPSIPTTSRGAVVKRWVDDGRCHHTIRYGDNTVDDIQFNVYMPDEIAELLVRAGFEVRSQMTWWTTERAPSRACARYQLECVRS